MKLVATALIVALAILAVHSAVDPKVKQEMQAAMKKCKHIKVNYLQLGSVFLTNRKPRDPNAGKLISCVLQQVAIQKAQGDFDRNVLLQRLGQLEIQQPVAVRMGGCIDTAVGKTVEERAVALAMCGAQKLKPEYKPADLIRIVKGLSRRRRR